LTPAENTDNCLVSFALPQCAQALLDLPEEFSRNSLILPQSAHLYS
jgi:hypothetical protein